MIARRSFLTGLGAMFAAPAIVRADCLMKIRGELVPRVSRRWLMTYDILEDRLIARYDVANFGLSLPSKCPSVSEITDFRLLRALERSLAFPIMEADKCVMVTGVDRRQMCVKTYLRTCEGGRLMPNCNTVDLLPQG